MLWKAHARTRMTGGELRPRVTGRARQHPCPALAPLLYPRTRACRSQQSQDRLATCCFVQGGQAEREREVGAWVPRSAQDTSGLALTWEGHPGPDASRSPTTGVCHRSGPDGLRLTALTRATGCVETKVQERPPGCAVCEDTPPTSPCPRLRGPRGSE